MRKMKLLSLLLAVLMLVSCVPVALFVGASAAEGDETESVPVSYKDPREGATKIYYAPTTSVTAAMLQSDAYYESATKLNGNTAIYSALTNGYAGTYARSGGFEAGSVLVIKFSGNQELNFSTNGGLKRSEYLAFTAPTLFRADGTKLPIVIEGVENNDVVPTLVLGDGAYTALGFANDYYFSNLTISKASTASHIFYAGSGKVVFHNVTFDTAGTVTFAGDNYTSDSFYGWTETHFDANKGADGLLSTGYTFGKNASVNSSTILAAVVADGHSGTDAYKTSYPKIESDLTDTNVETAVTKSKSVKYTNGKLLSSNANCVVTPTETSTSITIDNGKAPSTTADFTKVYARKGCSPVAKAEIKLVSGTVKYMYGDAYTNETANNGVKDTYANRPNREIYCGDTTITIDGGKVTDCVYGLHYSHLIGDYTVNLNGGDVKRINGTESLAKNASIKGNYLFHATDGTLGEYYGACEVVGEGNTIETRVEGGTFTSIFSCVRFGVSAITNNISGGDFQNVFYGASRNNYAGGDVTNNISGSHSTTKFSTGNTFYAGGGNASATLGTVITNISGGAFGLISKGAAQATSNTINIVSKNETDSIRFNNGSSTEVRIHTFDNFEMNGGTIHFYNCSVTANNAKGKVTVRSLGQLKEGVDYFAFTPTSKGALDVTAISLSTKARVVYEGEKIYVRADFGEIRPIAASLILTERIAVKFVFDKAAIDAVGKDNFDCAVILDGKDLTANAKLEENGDTYTLTTVGIGLPDTKTHFAICGDSVIDENFTIASLADAAITAWETTDPDWANWAKALKNLIGVVVDDAASTVAPSDKTYDKFTATKDGVVVTAGNAALVMNSAVGVKLNLTCTTLPANPVVKVNGNLVEGVYTAEGTEATITLYFAPQYMEENFTVTLSDGTAELFALEASVAGFAKALNTDAGNALLAYVQATTVVA